MIAHITFCWTACPGKIGYGIWGVADELQELKLRLLKEMSVCSATMN
jgi:hypothetical protein